MLAASTASPNPRAKITPKPENWSGVSQGLSNAKRAFQAGEMEEAESILHEVLEFAPNEPKAWAWQGRILQLQGNKDAATHHFKKAEALLKKYHDITSNTPISLPLTRILWQQGEYDAARGMLSTLLLRTPADEQLVQLSKEWGNSA